MLVNGEVLEVTHFPATPQIPNESWSAKLKFEMYGMTQIAWASYDSIVAVGDIKPTETSVIRSSQTETSNGYIITKIKLDLFK